MNPTYDSLNTNSKSSRLRTLETTDSTNASSSQTTEATPGYISFDSNALGLHSPTSGSNHPWTTNLKSLQAALVGSLSSLQFGYHIGEYNILEARFLQCIKGEQNNSEWTVTHPFENLPSCIRLDESQYGWLTSLLPLMALIGTFVAGVLLRHLSRRDTLLLNNLFFVVGSLFSCLSFNYTHLIIGRIFNGFASGISMVVLPIYLSEVAPTHLKGVFGTFNQLTIVLGIALAQLLGLLYSSSDGWRLTLAWGIFFPFLQLLILPYFEDSSNSQRSFEYESLTDNTILNENVLPSQSTNFFSELISLFTKKEYRFATILLLFLHLSQQLSGINAIMYFSTKILRDANVSNPKLITTLLNFFQFVATLFIIPLIESKGRRYLFIVSCGSMALSLFGLGITLNLRWNIMSCIFLFLSIGTYSLGLGALPFVLIAELFDGFVLPLASTLALSFNLIMNFVVGSSFLVVVSWFPKESPGDAFFLFMGYLILAGCLSHLFLPETKLESAVNNRKTLNSLVGRWF